ncbi:MAG: tail fiber domain-containing protein [Chitinophagaceae bacterium]
MYSIKKKTRGLFLLGLLIMTLMFMNVSQAQVKMGLNPTRITVADSSAILSLEDTAKGFLFPRMTIKQRDDMKVPGPATGLSVFVLDTRDTGFYVNYGTNTKPSWIKLANALKDTITISKIDTIYNKLIQTDSIFSILSQLDTIYNKLLQTDSIFSHTARIDTLYSEIARIDTLFAKTAHFDTVTIGKLKIRVSGKITDSIVVVDPKTDSLKRISPSSLNSNIYNTDGTLTSKRLVTMGNDTLIFNAIKGNFIYNPTDTAGKMGIGTANPIYRLHVNGSAYTDTVITKAVKLMNPLGGFSGYGISTNWGLITVSDQRLKENIKVYDGPSALNGINAIKIVEYDWKDRKMGPHVPIGVIAQNIQEVFPDAVEFDQQSGNLTLRSSLFPFYLIKATQELSNKVDEEKAKNTSLQKQIEEQGVRIQKLEKLVNQLMKSKK